MKMNVRYLLCALAVSLFCGACGTGTKKTADAPKPFADAVHDASRALMLEVRRQERLTRLTGATTVFMLDPIVDANTAEVNQASRAIENILREEASLASEKYVVVPISLDNYDSAKYLISGALLYASFSGNQKGGEKKYKLALAVVERVSGKVMASSEAWIADAKIDVAPIASYRDSPMYLKDKNVEAQIETAQMAPGQQAAAGYLSSLPTASLLAEADAAYEGDRLEQALGMYKTVSLRPDGQLMKTYAGLYQTNRRLGKQQEAEIAFGQLVNIAHQSNKITVKLLFNVASTDFISDAEQRSQYTIWLRQIGKLFARTNGCVVIAGHSSRTGNASYNEQLSLQRALAVQKLLQKDFPQIFQRSKAVGLGWKENMVGTGSDDVQDAIDRRVEFRLTDCGKS